jgi:xanthine/uracil/vitamin C permease (AzgA family)
MTSAHETRTITNPPARRTTTSSHEVAADRSSRRLLGLTSTLLALQVLNLAVFDDLRTDTSLGVLETFTKPQHLSSIVAVLVAVILVARRHRHAARVAVVVAWIEIAAFWFFHGIPVEIGPAKPYWGDGSGDALQWFGFLSIMACSAAIIVVGRKRSTTTATPTASTHPDDVEVMP